MFTSVDAFEDVSILCGYKIPIRCVSAFQSVAIENSVSLSYSNACIMYTWMAIAAARSQLLTNASCHVLSEQQNSTSERLTVAAAIVIHDHVNMHARTRDQLDCARTFNVQHD